MKKGRYIVVGLLIVFVLLLSNLGVMAQTPPPPQSPPARSSLPTRGGQAVELPQVSASGELASGDPIDALAIAQGKPGTVFRFLKQYGVTGAAYVDNVDYLNNPSALAFDQDGNLLVAEEAGARLLKFDADGEPVWQSGKGGFHYWWTGTGYSWPKDVAEAPDGTLWTVQNDIATLTNAEEGTILRNFPQEPNPEVDETYFIDLRGVAFDSGGRVYLSDAGRHRIQVFSFDGEGNPVYEATIGETDVPGTATNHFQYPAQIVIDEEDNLYVADTQNHRVQFCQPNAPSWPWNWICSTYDGGAFSGSEVNQLTYPIGLGLDADGILYIADSGNYRVKRCTGVQTCEVLVHNGLGYPTDVAVDADGAIFISDQACNVVFAYNGTDGVDEEDVYLGTLDYPYETDNQHYYWPHGIDVDARGNIIILEENGQRMTRLDKNGALLWNKGIPGIPTFGDAASIAWPRAVTTDAKGKIYLADGNGVRIFDPNGAQLGALPWVENDPHYQYGWVTGIAVDALGNIYIADANRHVVSVYNKALVWQRSIGVYNECGLDNAHLCVPMGIALDSARNLYVADWIGHRVQKFNKNGVFQMTFGSGHESDRVGDLNGPVDVAVDAKGNVYVAEENNSRVSVFSKTGAYLAMIGGWANKDGLFLNIGGLALDKAGNLYVTDAGNSRVQVFAPGVPYWAQINLGGFGRRENGQIGAMAVFKNQLYAAVTGWTMRGGLIYRLDKAGWTAAVDDGFDDGDTQKVSALFVYKNYLYAGTNLAEVYRSQDGLTWEAVIIDQFPPEDYTDLFYPGPLTGKVCMTVENRIDGAEVWCSPSGDRGTWQLELLAGEHLGTPDVYQINAMIEYNGATYLTTNNWNYGAWGGAQVWRKIGAGDWQQVNQSGFGDPNANGAHAMAVFTTPQKKTYLYVITEHHDGGESQIFRCQACAGDDWEEVSPLNLPYNQNAIPALQVIGKTMYAVIGNYDTGLGVWSTLDGVTWKQVGANGLSSASNTAPYTNYSAINFKGSLYIGAMNWDTGASVWKFCPTAKVCK